MNQIQFSLDGSFQDLDISLPLPPRREMADVIKPDIIPQDVWEIVNERTEDLYERFKGRFHIEELREERRGFIEAIYMLHAETKKLYPFVKDHVDSEFFEVIKDRLSEGRARVLECLAAFDKDDLAFYEAFKGLCDFVGETDPPSYADIFEIRNGLRFMLKERFEHLRHPSIESTIGITFTGSTERYQFVQKIRSEWEGYVENQAGNSKLYDDFIAQRKDLHLETCGYGVGGSYFVKNEAGETKFFLKPVDEDVGGINNPSGLIGLGHGLKEDESHQKELMTHKMAKLLGVEDVVPKVALVIVQDPAFYYRKGANEPKLCVLEEFIEDAIPLMELRHDLMACGYRESEIMEMIDQSDLEKISLLCLATNETDAHQNNILAYVKSVDAFGKKIYGLKKIDSSLCFPLQPLMTKNCLAYLPGGKIPFSKEMQNRIKLLDRDKVMNAMRELHMDEQEFYSAVTQIEAVSHLIGQDYSIKEVTGKTYELARESFQNSVKKVG